MDAVCADTELKQWAKYENSFYCSRQHQWHVCVYGRRGSLKGRNRPGDHHGFWKPLLIQQTYEMISHLAFA